MGHLIPVESIIVCSSGKLEITSLKCSPGLLKVNSDMSLCHLIVDPKLHYFPSVRINYRKNYCNPMVNKIFLKTCYNDSKSVHC